MLSLSLSLLVFTHYTHRVPFNGAFHCVPRCEMFAHATITTIDGPVDGRPLRPATSTSIVGRSRRERPKTWIESNKSSRLLSCLRDIATRANESNKNVCYSLVMHAYECTVHCGTTLPVATPCDDATKFNSIVSIQRRTRRRRRRRSTWECS